MTYLAQAIFPSLVIRFVQTGLVNAKFLSFAFLKELLPLELRVCTEKLVSMPYDLGLLFFILKEY